VATQGFTVWLAANTSWYLFNFRRTLIERLLADGYRVVALAPLDDYSERLTALGIRHVPLQLNNAGMNPVKEGVSLFRLTILMARQSPSLLLSFTPKPNIYGCLAAGMTGIPVVANISGLGRAFIEGGWLTRVVSMLYRAGLRCARRVFFQNPDDLALFVARALVKENKTGLLPGSGVDVHRFTPGTKTSEDGPFVFLLVARLLRDKGVSEYVQAARQILRMGHSVEFRIVGFVDKQNPTSFTQDEVENWCAEGVIKYLGPSDDVIQHYREADCVVLPSYREGCPRSLLEAASMGIPLITTDVPGCRQVVEESVNGFLCKLRDPDDLARKMIKMLQLPAAERAGMGKAGREKMLKEFDEKIVLDRYMATVREFVGIRPS
jgi:glycosyltransferase involved in cell wall biosynthesis